jgi:lysozyme family protein
MNAFDQSLTLLLKHEGGWSNHPRDRGGATNLGVTQRVWEAWTGTKASEATMRGLTPEKVAPLYRKNYWDATRCDDLPPALALCVMDFAVNAGPARAAKMLQRLMGVTADGEIGPKTIAAVKRFVAEHGEAQAVRDYQQMRRGYYRGLGTFKTFGKGWLRRVDEVESAALRMLP